MGGPDGGDGSRAVMFIWRRSNMNTLDIFNHNQKLWAENGQSGRVKCLV